LYFKTWNWFDARNILRHRFWMGLGETLNGWYNILSPRFSSFGIRAGASDTYTHYITFVRGRLLPRFQIPQTNVPYR
jgi:hypothetical protein